MSYLSLCLAPSLASISAVSSSRILVFLGSMRLEETAEIQATSSSAFQASFPFKVTDVYPFRQEIFNCGNVRFFLLQVGLAFTRW